MNDGINEFHMQMLRAFVALALLLLTRRPNRHVE